VRGELAKVQKDKDELKRAYDELIGKAGGESKIVKDYQRKKAVFEAEIGIT
jgi:hypothetical protein